MVKVKTSADKRIPKNSMLLSIDRHRIDDVIEYNFYNDITTTHRIVVEHNSRKISITTKPHEKLAIQLEEPVYRSCENNCHFCFVNGLPQGLRKELYFRDDDYRLSFLFGNFLSLTNITNEDIKRIARLKLSPLYVSVHTTVPGLRSKLFQNKKAGMILEQLSSLVNANVKVHCQIVIIPGITDGKSLITTIHELSVLYPGVCSIGVVPVGKTKYMRRLPDISRVRARDVVMLVNRYHMRYRKKFGRGLVYCADEFYFKAGIPLPQTSYYDDFPQYENGIGMARTLLDEIGDCEPGKPLKGDFLLLTGELAYPLIHRFASTVNNHLGRKSFDVRAVPNSFLGRSVTVSGLIGARDLSRTISSVKKRYDYITLPPHCVNDHGQFLDGETVNRRRILVSPPSIKELLQCLQ